MTRSPELLLHSLHPNLHTSSIVASSAGHQERAEGTEHGNAESKIAAYLERIEELSARDRGAKLLALHLLDQMVVVELPDSHWERLGRIARDNGQNINLSHTEKDKLSQEVKGIQRDSLLQWTDYFTQTNDQYPTWFKYYALEGLSKMSTFNVDKGVFNRRSSTSTAPYPSLDPAVLAQVYDSLQNGEIAGFNKLYSEKIVLQSDEEADVYTSDVVRGEWQLYTDPQKIAGASQGTPWCIASPSMAKSYLDNGNGQFYLFHTKDSETGEKNRRASASIRMRDGVVSEVSGVKSGSAQALDDWLVPEVSRKLTTLPGGERYVRAFDDKKKLIAMDKKFQSGVDFTIDELRFLYEVDRPIEAIGYGRDVRVSDFKVNVVNHHRQLEAVYGKAAESMVLTSDLVNSNYELLLANGFSPEAVIENMSHYVLQKDETIHRLLTLGVDLALFYGSLDVVAQALTLERMLASGQKVDIEQVFTHLSSSALRSNNGIAEIMIRNSIPTEKVVEVFRPNDMNGRIISLLEAGADISVLVDKLSANLILHNFKAILDRGFNVDVAPVLLKASPKTIAAHLPILVRAGAEIDIPKLLSRLTQQDTLRYLKNFQEAGVAIDVDTLLSKVQVSKADTAKNLLRAAGLDASRYKSKIHVSRSSRANKANR